MFSGITSAGDTGNPFIKDNKDNKQDSFVSSEENSNHNKNQKKINDEFLSMAESIQNKVESDQYNKILNPPQVKYDSNLHLILITQNLNLKNFEDIIENNNTDQIKVIKQIKPRHLRLKCGCALCVNEFTGEPILDESKVPEDVFPKLIEKRGNYAVSVVWSDGHRSSIYPYKKLLDDNKV